MSHELFLSEEKATKAMVDAARLAEELRQEQEMSQAFEREHKLLDCQVKDLQGRLDEAEIESLKGGKKAMNKLESRIREIESEIGAENRRFADAQKNLRRSDRRVKEMSFSNDEDRKNHDRMEGLVENLQGKMRTYKKQIEEAEEIAALNLGKFRHMQSCLADAEERADLNEQALAKFKRRCRSSSRVPMVKILFV